MEKLKEKIELKKSYIVDINDQLENIDKKITILRTEKNDLDSRVVKFDPDVDQRKLEITEMMITGLNEDISKLTKEDIDLKSTLVRLKRSLGEDIINLDIMIEDALEKDMGTEHYEPTNKELEELKLQIENRYIEKEENEPTMDPMNIDFDADKFADTMEGF